MNSATTAPHPAIDTLPSDPAAERIVLASALVLPDMHARAVRGLDPALFYATAHRRIFEAVRSLDTVDTAHVMLWLTERGHHDEAALVAEIVSESATTTDLAAPLARLGELAARRRVITLANTLMKDAAAGELGIEALASEYGQQIVGCATGCRGLPEIVSAAALAAEPPRLTPVLIDGILRRGHKLLLSGPSKAGKSFALIRLALALVHGHDWMGHRCERASVLFVNLEIDAGSLWHRITAVAAAMGVSCETDALHVWNLRGHAMNSEALARETITRVRGWDIGAIIVDPLYKVELADPRADENGAASRAAALRCLDEIAEQTGAALIVSAHHAKGPQGHRAAIDRASGSGVIGRDPDAICCLTETEVSGVYRVEWVLREFASPEDATVVWEYPLHREAPELSGVAVAGGRRPALTVSDFRQALAEACGDRGEATIEAVQAALGGRGSRSTFQRLARELAGAGLAVRVTADKVICPKPAHAAQNSWAGREA